MGDGTMPSEYRPQSGDDQWNQWNQRNQRRTSGRRSSMAQESTLRAFSEALGTSTPTPGGGAAAALAGALAAALAERVAQLTTGKAKFSAVEPQVRGVIERARQ